jgi:hypothetical protein
MKHRQGDHQLDFFGLGRLLTNHCSRRNFLLGNALDFGSRTENRIVFRVARVVKKLEFCRAPVWHRSTPVEGVGLELDALSW